MYFHLGRFFVCLFVFLINKTTGTTEEKRKSHKPISLHTSELIGDK
jgi:hypothetical protein